MFKKLAALIFGALLLAAVIAVPVLAKDNNKGDLWLTNSASTARSSTTAEPMPSIRSPAPARVSRS